VETVPRVLCENCPEFTSNLANGLYRGFVEQCPDDNNRYITIPTEVSWNSVHRTMIDLTILTEVVIWIPLHESSVRMVIYIIVMWTPFNKTSLRIFMYIIVLWTPFNKTSLIIVIYIIVNGSTIPEIFLGNR
jgi:hypothetical protein